MLSGISQRELGWKCLLMSATICNVLSQGSLSPAGLWIDLDFRAQNRKSLWSAKSLTCVMPGMWLNPIPSYWAPRHSLSSQLEHLMGSLRAPASLKSAKFSFGFASHLVYPHCCICRFMCVWPNCENSNQTKWYPKVWSAAFWDLLLSGYHPQF